MLDKLNVFNAYEKFWKPSKPDLKGQDWWKFWDTWPGCQHNSHSKGNLLTKLHYKLNLRKMQLFFQQVLYFVTFKRSGNSSKGTGSHVTRCNRECKDWCCHRPNTTQTHYLVGFLLLFLIYLDQSTACQQVLQLVCTLQQVPAKLLSSN